MQRYEIPGFCTLCRSRCGTLNVVEAGRLVAVKALPGHPTGRATCTKGRAAPELVHSTRRLRTPLRRTRPKDGGDPGWEAIGWDEAMTEIAGRLSAIRAESGAEAVAFGVTSPSASPMSDSIEWVERFIRVFGSPNMLYATEICNWHRDYAFAFTFGSGMGSPDYARSDLIVLWGHNPSNTWLAQAGEIAEGQSRGARLMVVDPRRTAHATRSDLWLRVRPGADAALALGIIHLLLSTGRFDEAFVRRWTNAPFLVRTDTGRFLRAEDLGDSSGYVATGADGTPFACDTTRAPDARLMSAALTGCFMVHTGEGPVACRPAFDLLAGHCADYAPERVEALTSVPAATIRAAADAIAGARSVSLFCWTGVGQHTNASQTSRALGILYALTGSVDRVGGNLMLNRQPAAPVMDRSLMSDAQWAKALGLAERPLGPPSQGYVTARDLARAITAGDPYRIRALFTFGANALVSQADTGMVEAALRALEFSVHCDLFETPTGRHADILLPVGTPWEREGLRVGFEISAEAEEIVQLRPRMVPRQGEARSDMEIVFELACRLGHGGRFFGGDIEAGWNHVLAPLGLTIEDLRAAPQGVRRPLAQAERKYAAETGGGARGFATESRRVELYSETLLRIGQQPLPGAGAGPAPATAFPLMLTTAKSGYFCHSQHRSLASVRRRAPEPTVTLHPDIAHARGLAVDDRAIVSTPAGRAAFRTRLDADLDPAVIVADYGWWQAAPDLGLPGYGLSGAAGSNYNSLIDTRSIDPISGSVPHRGFPCDVSAAGEADRRLHWDGFRRFTVVERVEEADGVVSLGLAPAGGGILPDFRPGQHVTVRILGRHGSPAAARSYSLSGAAGAPQSRYRITVRRLDHAPAPGFVSDILTRRLTVGDTVDLQRPAGRFLLPDEADFPIVLIAGGIGITPFIGLLETAAARGSQAELVLHYGNRNAVTHAFRDRIAALKGALPGLRVVDHYSRPLPGEASGRAFDRAGRIGAGDIDQDLIDRRARFYLCGPGAMPAELEAGLKARGVPGFEIFKEVFRAADGVLPAADRTHTIRFARSGRTLTWTRACGTILDLAEASGLNPASGCRVGQCESCAVGIVDGTIHHLVPPDEIDAGTCLTCQAVPASDLVLDA